LQFLTYVVVYLKKRRKAEYLAMLLLNWSFVAFFFNQTRKAFFIAIKYQISTINRLWMYIKMFIREKYVTMQHDYCLKLYK